MRKIITLLLLLVTVKSFSQEIDPYKRTVRLRYTANGTEYREEKPLIYIDTVYLNGSNDSLIYKIDGRRKAVGLASGGGGYDSTLMASVKRLKDTAAALRSAIGSGGGGGTPGGSNKQFNYNNSGAFAGSGNLTQESNKILITGTSTSVTPFQITGIASQTAPFMRLENSSNQARFIIDADGKVNVGAAGIDFDGYYAAAGYSGNIRYTTSATFVANAPFSATNFFSPGGGSGVGFRMNPSSLLIGVNEDLLNVYSGTVGINTNSPASTLEVSGSLGLSITTKTSTYTATASDHTILCDASGGGFTINLPAASSCAKRVYVVKKIDNSGNGVLIDGNASETVDGATTITISVQWATVMLQSNGTSWYIIN